MADRWLPKNSKTHCFKGHDFTPENSYFSPDGTRWCRICRRERARSYHLANKFGIAVEDVEELSERQNGQCAICGEALTPGWATVDHDHSTGDVRGLLCRHCNTGLGQFKESDQILERARNYLIEARKDNLQTNLSNLLRQVGLESSSKGEKLNE